MANSIAVKNNSKYVPCKYMNHGFYIGKLGDIVQTFDALRDKINNSRIFENYSIASELANEVGKPSGKRERNQVVLEHLNIKQKLQYMEIISHVENVSNELVAKCNKDLGYKIDPANSVPTIMNTISSKVLPQKIHVDMDYDSEYEEQLLCIVSIQDNTKFRVVGGSHKYATLQDLLDDKTNNSGGFWIPVVITLNKGDFLVTHPKLLHSGWSAEEYNVRLHYYLNLKQIVLSYEPDLVEKSSTYYMNDEISSLFNGDVKREHIKSLKRRSSEEHKSSVAAKCSRFTKKQRVEDSSK